MKILWVATKSPWPPTDGGRLVMWNTLGGLVDAGHEITLVAPLLGQSEKPTAEALSARCRPELVKESLRPRWLDGLIAIGSARPWTLVRHSSSKVRRRVQRVLAASDFDVIHVEQVQALAAVEKILCQEGGTRPAVVLRSQNVESQLWRMEADRHLGVRRALLRRQAHKLAAREGQAVNLVDRAVALTPEDASELEVLARAAAGSGPLAMSVRPPTVVPAPFEPELPAGQGRLEGDPALILFGSTGWGPNFDGALWLTAEIWPTISQQCPGARLHLFGLDTLAPAGRIENHPTPEDSREVMREGSVLLVPLKVASGVRMKILEAWSRGIAVIATTAAARGLGTTSGKELLVADRPKEFADAVEKVSSAEVRQGLIDRGREHLAQIHTPTAVAARLNEVYEEASASRGAPSSRGAAVPSRSSS